MVRIPAITPTQTVLAAALIFALFFLATFPPIHVAIDEHQYLKNSLLLQNGQLKTADPLTYCGGIVRGDEYVSSYHIGKSVSLIPFTWAPFPFALLSGLLIHLLNTFIFSLILRGQKIDVRWSILFLLLPVFVWESRTLFSETLALTFLLAGTYFYLRPGEKHLFYAGLLVGLAAFVRYETILIAVGFAMGLAWRSRHSLRKLNSPFWMFAAGGIVSALLLLTWNAWYFGNPFSTQLGSPARLIQTFPQPLFLANAFLLVATLLIAYPLMLASPFFSKRMPHIEIGLGALFTLILFGQTNNLSVYEFFSPLTFTGRMRYLIPVAGLLLLPYVEVLDRILPELKKRVPMLTPVRVFAIITLVLLGGAGFLMITHQRFLETRENVSNALLTSIPEDSLTIGSSDDCVYFLPLFSGDRKYVRVDSPDINALFDAHPHVYVVQILYSNQSDSEVRQDVINAERAIMAAFIKTHADELTLVQESRVPHLVRIYQKK